MTYRMEDGSWVISRDYWGERDTRGEQDGSGRLHMVSPNVSLGQNNLNSSVLE